jgi:hypothetical protein
MFEDFETADYEALTTAVSKAGGQRAFARAQGIPRSTLQDRLKQAKAAQFRHRPIDQTNVVEVKHGIRRFILTSAQDTTRVDGNLLTSLETYRDWLGKDGPCEIMIGGITYNKSLFEDHGKKKPVWADRLLPYMRWERIRLDDHIDFCAEMNTRPTAKTPLQGFETYTRHRWGIFPHAKVQLRSVPTMKFGPCKQIMTTGSITLPNYVPLRAGIEAQFHHVMGAVLVEIDADGTFFARHLLADEDGTFYDLDRYVTPTGVSEGHRVAAINWGDIHTAKIDRVLSGKSFGIRPTTDSAEPGKGRLWEKVEGVSMLDTLMPEYQFFHDVADFSSRNHHNLNDPHVMFELFTAGVDRVQDEMTEVAMLLSETRRDWCQSVVVESNHDLALRKWLKEGDYRRDPPNARFFLQCQLASYDAIERRDRNFSIFEHVMRNVSHAYDCAGVRFLKTDESYPVLGIEKGMHGHNGANGSRGSVFAFSKMGPKITIGHFHAPGINDGAYAAGVKGKLDLGYNVGLSSWSQADVVTLPNGKRQIVTWCNGRYRL